MKTSLDRIQEDIMSLSKFNRTLGEGCTRFSYSKEDIKAKEYLIDIMKELGLNIKIDGIGNIRARLRGSEELPSIMIGSHIDTVKHGGIFDGVVGVVSALEIIRVMEENNIKTKHPIELVIFAEEEGSNFGATTSGSKAMVGKLGLKELKDIRCQTSESYYDLLKKVGLDPDSIEKDKVSKKDVAAMLELHIEQSVVLENLKVPIGIVTGISGIRIYSIELQGESNHAGATPMSMRKDPMNAAARIIASLNNLVRTKGREESVITVGKIECFPNVSNVIPQKVEFTVDIRDVCDEIMDNILEGIKALVKDISEEIGVIYKIKYMGESKGIGLSQKIISIIEEVVSRRKIGYQKMNSGAVHDSALMAEITDVGMIFVKSIGGRSHVPEEFTPYEDINLGCDMLLDVVLELDKSI